MKKRIFVAVDISADARRKAAAYISGLRNEFSDLKIGWDKSEKLHLTLKFLGDIDEEQLSALENVVENVKDRFSSFNLQISETGVFPSERNARVLWLGVKGEVETLKKINAVLETECEKIGFKKENRNFTPHLTIARIREPQKTKKLIQKHLENKFEPAGFEVSEIVIYESVLQPAGSIYQKLKTISFSTR